MYPTAILRNLPDYGYSGEIHPVNPKRQTVFGLPCYPDVTQTPQRADVAILTIPRRAVLPILRQCLEVGIPAALIITAGFAETDEEGRRLENEMPTLLLQPSSPVPRLRAFPGQYYGQYNDHGHYDLRHPMRDPD